MIQNYKFLLDVFDKLHISKVLLALGFVEKQYGHI
jgi:hypothetical protein